jgi:hypothetical protein
VEKAAQNEVFLPGDQLRIEGGLRAVRLIGQQMTKKDDSESDEQFWLEVDRAWRMMDKVMRSILRENPKLDPKNKRDQNAIARLLDERVKNDDRLRRAMAVTTMGGHILEQKTKH